MPDNPSHEQMMHNMHDTFWRDDQIMVVFYSTEPLFVEGKNNAGKVLELDLGKQLDNLNRFLGDLFPQQNRQPIHLAFLGEAQTPATTSATQFSANSYDTDKGLQLPGGVYLFGLGSPIQKEFATIQTIIPAFLQIVPGPSNSGMAAQAVSAGHSHGAKTSDEPLIPFLVNNLNDYITSLNAPTSYDAVAHLNAGGTNTEKMTIAFASPNWLYGETPDVTQGCPLTPPMPVNSTVSNWHIEIPDLDKHPTYHDIANMKGDCTKIFILDTIPERGVISRAAHDASTTNPLLHLVNETVDFNYDLMSGVQALDLMAATHNASVGKDIYGEHYRTLLPDHGLFIAGMVRDIACDADIECIRILDDLCVGDLGTMISALWRIYKRKLSVKLDASEKEDLQDTPVVINLSLVIPTDDEAQGSGITLNTTKPGSPGSGFDNILEALLFWVLQALSKLGVVIVASAGNEGDDREMPAGSPRPKALRPAYWSKDIDNLIAVGAVTKTGNVATYSCYPGSKSISTWGGRVPDASLGEIKPPKAGDPKSDHPKVTIDDAPIGVYASVEYPPKSAVPADPPEQYYTASNQSGWAYWIGTSFATPIVSAAAARAAQWKKHTGDTDSVYDILKHLIAGKPEAQWDRLHPDPTQPNGAGGNTPTPMLRAEQLPRH